MAALLLRRLIGKPITALVNRDSTSRLKRTKNSFCFRPKYLYACKAQNEDLLLMSFDFYEIFPQLNGQNSCKLFIGIKYRRALPPI